MGSVSDLIGATVYLDANIFIYLLEGFAPLGDRVGRLFAEIDAGRIQGITSELTLAELLVKPIRDGNASATTQYQALLSSHHGLEVLPVSRQVLVESARLRAAAQFKLLDAIHAAAVLISGCTFFLTNDKRFAGMTIPVCLLSGLDG